MKLLKTSMELFIFQTFKALKMADHFTPNFHRIQDCKNPARKSETGIARIGQEKYYFYLIIFLRLVHLKKQDEKEDCRDTAKIL